MKYPAVILYLKTKDNGEELRWTLRGLKYLTNWNGEVFVIGDKESWFKNITVLETKRKFGKKHVDQRNRLRMAIRDSRIADDFLYFNDDFLVQREVKAVNWHGGEITREHGFSNRGWNQVKFRTRNYLRNEHGFETVLDYDLHLPMIFNKKKLAKVLDLCDKQHPDFEIQFRTVYGNLHKIGGSKTEDGKYQYDAPITSTNDSNQLANIKELEPSKFEPAPPRHYTSSVLMAVYNTEDYVARALDSIPKTVEEIIVCDDGSTDNSRNTVKQWAKDNPDTNIRILWNKENKGVGFTKNKLIDSATQEYFTFLDSDDYFLPAINKVLKALDGSDIVYYNLIRNDGKQYRISERTKLTHPGEVKYWRREFVGDIRNGNERHAEDEALYLKLLKKNPTEKFTNELAKHYEYPREGSVRYKFLRGEDLK